MTTWHRTLTPLVLIALACTSSLSTAADVKTDYEIHMTRPFKVGSSYKLSSTGSSRDIMTVSAGDRVLEKSDSQIDATLEGTVTVLEINERQQEKKLKLVLDRFTVKTEDDRVERELLYKGAELILTREKGTETIYRLDNNPVKSEISSAMAMLISLPQTDATDDDLFGTKKRQKVGDSWDVNAEATAKDLLAVDLAVAAKDIKGTVTLDKITVVDGINCMQLSASMTLKDVSPPFPPGVALENSTMTADFKGTFPVDPSALVLSESQTLSMKVTGSGRPDRTAPYMTFSADRTMTTSKTRKAVK